jgi:hypothetical protein
VLILRENLAIYKEKQLGRSHAAFWAYIPVITLPYNREDLFITDGNSSRELHTLAEVFAAFREISPVKLMKQ